MRAELGRKFDSGAGRACADLCGLEKVYGSSINFLKLP